MRLLLPLLVLLTALTAGCAQNPYLSDETRLTGHLSEQSAALHASAGPLRLTGARLITGNDAAFRSKLALVEQAQESIDAAYYIFSDDYSSSVLAKALIDAARRGVQVRLLVDYNTNYKNLDLFTYMERAGGSGSLQVRFYGRPSREIVTDAVYLTMGCGDAEVKFPADSCSQSKVDEVAQFFAAELIDGRPAAELNISNLDSGFSGLFLSGLYSKDPALMAFAVLNGQAIDPASLDSGAREVSPADKERLKQLGRLYLDARVGAPFRRLASRIELAAVSALFGDTVDPIHETLVVHLPVERQGSDAALHDWEHLTDFLHHKLLLADRRGLQMGGRNVEDSYHTRANPLLEKYRFMDTDLRADIAAGGERVDDAFDALWNFRTMVATTTEIRRHAPNDMAANGAAFKAAEQSCAPTTLAERMPCFKREFDSRALPLAERERLRGETLEANAARYWAEYPYARTPDPDPEFPVDAEAAAYYLENLPFHGAPGARDAGRSYGAVNGEEALYGKRIHGIWLAGLRSACATSTPEAPRRVVLHHAYFFPPADLVQALAKMVDGRWDCSNVRLTILTNSLETTDLNVVNLFARHSAKAFTEYALAHRDPLRAAQVDYLEYRPFEPGTRLSLHTKVTLLGDDLVVGSANADLRSLMMDSNNAMLLRHAPALLAAYGHYLDGLTSDTVKVVDRTRDFVETPRETMLAQDLGSFRAMLAKYRAERWMDKEQEARAEVQLRARLDDAYALTKAMLAGSGGGDAEQFNRLFKPL